MGTRRNVVADVVGSVARVDTSAPPFLPTLDTVLYLPPPPSVNRTRKIDYVAAGQHKKWIEQADKHILEAGGLRKFARISGKFEATLVLDEHLNHLDLDNAAKAVIDYARRINLIVNDDKKHMRKVTIEWGRAPHGCRLILRPVEG